MEVLYPRCCGLDVHRAKCRDPGRSGTAVGGS